jgi:hypothetical protein
MRQLFLCLLLSIFSVGAYSQKQELNLQGAWKMVAFQEKVDGKTVNVFPGYATIDQIKIWSGNQVMFVAHYKSKKHVNDDYGSGTWKMIGNKCEETCNISSYKEWINKTVRIEFEFNKDTLIQIFPLNEKFERDNNTVYTEKYLKIN